MSNGIYVSVGVDGRSIPAGGEAGQILQKNTNEDFDLIWATPAGGTSANIPQPASSKSPQDGGTDGTGTVGTGVSFARQDHAHPLNIPTSGTPQMDGTGAIGNSAYYAPFNHVHPHDTYSTGFQPAGNIILTNSVHIYPNVASLPAAGTAGRIAFVKA